ncbi:glycosyltransferase [Simiduia aestuariiviva]|uniref:Glycosyltransferase involved in cell wall biosynthesis n=1 Tax=Simiduia aestuariiviva TaxID=1510459 RepID=A0A839UXK0_9GAMM|nr:glycosyltransferase [Simiduia aestuariiviva]MBB3170087.1 glycosyltransferase involved in cell wall biosynthesis [Simiduia aestuariiviva]
MSLSAKSAWITWEYQPRNISMAKALGVQLHQLISNKPRLLKYAYLTIKTLPILLNRNIEVIFVQNPSIVLCTLAIAVAKPLGKKVIIDAHNAGIFPLEGRSKILNALCKWLFNRADLTIVTNSQISTYVSENGGKPVIMPDPLPSFPTSNNFTPGNHFFLICSWSDDEPYGTVIDAFRNMPDCTLKISGNYTKKLSKAYIENLPDNIILCGFITRKEYEETLASATAVIDLTDREMCVLCGIYEGVAAEVPVITTPTTAIFEVFENHVYYTKSDQEDIIKITKKITAIDRISIYEKAIKAKKYIIKQQESRIDHIKNVVINTLRT